MADVPPVLPSNTPPKIPFSSPHYPGLLEGVSLKKFVVGAITLPFRIIGRIMEDIAFLAKELFVTLPKAGIKLFGKAGTMVYSPFIKAASHKGVIGTVIGAFVAIAAGLGIGSWVKNSKTEKSQTLEANDLQASIAMNKAARVETSAAMGQDAQFPDGNWRGRVKGGIPGQQLPN